MFTDSVFAGKPSTGLAGAQILLCSDGVLGDRLSFADFTELCEEIAAAPGWSPVDRPVAATAGGTFDDDQGVGSARLGVRPGSAIGHREKPACSCRQRLPYLG